MEDSEAIRKLIEKWALAVRERDIEAILANHAEDIVMYNVPPPFQSVGIESYRQTWEIFFAGTQPGVFDIGNLHISAGDAIAFAYADMRCSAKENSGAFTHFPFRLTMGLEKINGLWSIVHEHHSVPAE